LIAQSKVIEGYNTLLMKLNKENLLGRQKVPLFAAGDFQ
jgi:hypothetical protein